MFFYSLYNNVKIPCVGFGTWQIPDGIEAVSAVKYALETGYRHIDTAEAYGNEESVGIAVRESGLPREKIFVTSKLRNPSHGYENTVDAFEKTMKKLDMDYLDLFLIHWPNPAMYRKSWQKSNAGTWRAFEEFYTDGRICSIGISNFEIHHIEELMKTALVKPMVNQIRLCPGETRDKLVGYCKERDILLEGYGPQGTGLVFDVPELKKIAGKYGKSVAQVSIRWSLQKGFLPLPKASSRSHIENNAAVFDFELSEEDVKEISELRECCGIASDPDKVDF